MRITAVEFMSLGKLQARTLSPTDATIVILNADTPFPPKQGRRRLTLTFWDTTSLSLPERLLVALLGNNPDLCVKVRNLLARDRNGWPWRPPMKGDAVQVASFVRNLPKEVNTVLVACEYGQSRSRAIAEWIGKQVKAPVTGDESKRPNPILAALLKKVS